MINRRDTRKVMLGDIIIGGNSPITVQSMTNTRTYDIENTVKQILSLEDEGCEIIRVAVPDIDSAKAISKIKDKIHIPLVADIQFDYRLAIESMKNGVDGIRINPGNIGSREKVKEVVEMAKSNHIPIRVGVNAGSLEKSILDKYGKPTPEALVESAMRHVNILEDLKFYDIVISLKASDVLFNIKAYKLMSEKVNYPLHLGITEAGPSLIGTIKSSVGIGTLLYEGIGDTIRVSLTGDPVDEVKVGFEILKSLNLRHKGINIISCPTCARCRIDLIKMAKKVESSFKDIKKPLNIAVMGCAVNGPGEAREADIGLAGGNGKVAIFRKGKILKTVPEKEAIIELKKLMRKMI